MIKKLKMETKLNSYKVIMNLMLQKILCSTVKKN